MNRPDIVIVYTDQMRADALGCVDPHLHTPNLDRLAAQGVRFDRCFVQSPVCMPSRVSMLTGRYPSDLGITHMGVPVPEDVRTLPDLLAPYNYRTANIGKLHFLPHANRDHRLPHPRYGFDVLELSDEPGPYPDAYRAWLDATDPRAAARITFGLPPAAAAWQQTMSAPRSTAPPPGRSDFTAPVPFPGPDGLTHPAFVAERSRAFLRSVPANQPLLCVASFFAPHAPFVVPQRFLDLYQPDELPLPDYPPDIQARRAESGPDDAQLRAVRHGYYASVSEVDHHVGAILDELDRLGRADNTVVVLVADHGEWLGEHLRFGKSYPAADAVSRVPLIVRWPRGVAAPGHVAPGIVEAVDVVPTLLACAGIQIPPTLAGRDLRPALAGTDLPPHAALTEFTGWKALRTEGHRYVVHADGTERLWDLAADPGEYRDIAGHGSQADVVAEHRRLMLARLLSAERPRPAVWPY